MFRKIKTHNGLLLCIPIWVALFVPTFCFAQNSNERNIGIVSLFEKLEKEEGFQFAYNARLFQNLEIPQPPAEMEANEVLVWLASVAPLTIEKSAANTYLILPQRQNYSVEVLDAETAHSLPQITFQLNGENPKVILPEKDHFLLEALFPTDSISVSTSYYQSQSLTVANLAALNGRITLQPDSLLLNEFTVISYLLSGINSNLKNHALEINMNELGLLAGETDGDVFKLLKALPGIQSPNGKPGSFNLRGSPFDQNLTFLDNIPIYHTGHYFGTFSPYNPNIIDKITVHRSTLPASWGGRVGGLIDIRTVEEIPDSAEYGFFANTVMTGGHIKTAIVKEKLGLSLSARSVYPVDYQSPKLDAYSDLNFQGSRISPAVISDNLMLEEFVIRFNDLNGKLSYSPNPNQNLSISFLRIDNNFNYIFNSRNQGRTETNESFLDNFGVTGEWTGNISPKSQGSISVTRSGFSLYQLAVDTEGPNNRVQKDQTTTNSIDDLRWKNQWDLEINNRNKLTLGYALTQHNLDFDEREFMIESNDTVHRTRKDQAFINSGYTEFERWWGKRLVTNFGLRLEQYSLLSKVFLDPRFTFSYLGSNALTFKGSIGRSHQYIKQHLPTDFDDFRVSNQFWFLADERTPVLTGKQGMLGAIYQKSDWLIDLEIYQKETNGITTQVFQQNVKTGDLFTTGGDLLVKKKWSKLETWLSFTLSKTNVDFDTLSLAFYDQTHVLNFTIMLPFKRFDFALSWGFMSGVPVLPLLFDNPMDTPFEPNFEDRYPAQHQLDFSGTYDFSKPGASWGGVLGISILNLYDQENVINHFRQNPDMMDGIRRNVGFSPNAQISITF